jgi:hypothetical protein
LAHTGQNYDYNLNGVFFKDLKLADPDIYMEAVGDDLGSTMGNIIDKSYKVMVETKPDAVLVLGDTNSCLSVIGAKRLHIPIFHMEAGNRCKDECLPEETNLVLEAGTKGNGGEIFVFDMGKPVRIADLAERMIKLSGATDVEIKYTGLRPGEKLYEEVLNELEGTKPSFHEKIRIASVREYDYQEVNREIQQLIDVSWQFDDMETVKIMKRIVPEFKSNNSVYDVLDK